MLDFLKFKLLKKALTTSFRSIWTLGIPDEKFVNARRWFKHIQFFANQKLPEVSEKVTVKVSKSEPVENEEVIRNYLNLVFPFHFVLVFPPKSRMFG